MGLLEDVLDEVIYTDEEARLRRLERRVEAAAGAAVSRSDDESSALRQQLAAQHRQILALRATVKALVNTVRDNLIAPGTVDARVLDARIEAAIEDALAPPDHAAEERAALARLVRCPRCGREVPAASTTITAAGTVCDRCAA